MDVYMCGVVCLCINHNAYCSGPDFINLPFDIRYVHVNNITFVRDVTRINEKDTSVDTTTTMIIKDIDESIEGKDIKQIAGDDKGILIQTPRYINTRSFFADITISKMTKYYGYTTEITTYNPLVFTSSENITNKWIVLLLLLSALLLIVIFCCLYYIIKKRTLTQTANDTQIEMGVVTYSDDNNQQWSSESSNDDQM